MKFRPTYDRIVIERLDKKAKGGIVLPSSVKFDHFQGVVVAVGPGRTENGKRIPSELKVGDKVLYAKALANELTDGGRRFDVIREIEVFVVEENEDGSEEKDCSEEEDRSEELL